MASTTYAFQSQIVHDFSGGNICTKKVAIASLWLLFFQFRYTTFIFQPFICNHFAAGETSDWNDHDAVSCIVGIQCFYVVYLTYAAASRGSLFCIMANIQCPICLCAATDLNCMTGCGHVLCRTCCSHLPQDKRRGISCPVCRTRSQPLKMFFATSASSSTAAIDTLLSTIFVPQIINGHTVGLMTGSWEELKSMFELAVKKGASIIGIKKFLKRSAEANNAYLASLAARPSFPGRVI